MRVCLSLSLSLFVFFSPSLCVSFSLSCVCVSAILLHLLFLILSSVVFSGGAGHLFVSLSTHAEVMMIKKEDDVE